ncbi:hypothetical protein [Arthrobacter sp. HLT1-20]
MNRRQAAKAHIYATLLSDAGHEPAMKPSTWWTQLVRESLDGDQSK